YSLRLFNDTAAPVTISGFVQFEINLTARSLQTFLPQGPIALLDDAVTNSIIHVDRAGRVVSTEVSVRIDHPRVSDLVLHLISPDGSRILLAENRGGLATNGYGISALTTNVSPPASSGDANANTNVIMTSLNSGIVNIDYDFFTVPDSLRVYYDGLRIFDSGSVTGAGRFTVPFGPGIDTNVVIVMNEGGNPAGVTMWTYSAQVLSGDIVYATFSENTNLALVPIKFALPPFATNLPGSNVTTFFTSGFETVAPGNYSGSVDGWTITTNSVDVIADATRAHSGTNFLSLGTGGIRRTLPTTEGDFYNLEFAYRRDLPAIPASAQIGLEGVFTNNFIGSPSWNLHSTSFAAAASGTSLDIVGLEAGMLFDSFSLTKGGDPNYFLPEESLKTLIGKNARGDWQLEIWDNRAGAPLGQLVSWKLHLTFASTNAVATVLSNNVSVTNTVAGSEIKYFIIDVPLFATRATNILVSGGGPLNLLFNQTQLPVGDSASGDVTLLFGTMNGTNILTTGSFPILRPGERYYLGVQNLSAAQTNFFTLNVTFDDTNNLVSVTPLTNAVSLSTNLPLSSSIQYYQYDLSNSVSAIEFRLYNLSADADLVVRRGQLPSQTVFDYNSNFSGTNEEVITVATPTPGRYYLGVYGFFPTNAITYTVLVTEGAAASPPIILTGPTVTAAGFRVTASTIIGAQYEFSFSTDLVTWTVISVTTATANVTTFTDPTPPDTQTARFYRVRKL
ncbi:MAG: proprotein convertase P-domain-containing protein, partial [Verrucomicrobiota bacterium]